MDHPKPHDIELPSGSPLLQRGLTCWRTPRAGRFAPIVDAVAYFGLAREALLRARQLVMFISWEFDARIALDPDHPLPGWPDRLGRFLFSLAERRPDLRIYVLQWDPGLVGTLVRGATPLYVLSWLSTRRVRFKLDSTHPPGASHHQKILVIDDALAFCGGNDRTDDRWETRPPRSGLPRPTPVRALLRPFHDATVAVDGPAAAALGDLARERWGRATGSGSNRRRGWPALSPSGRWRCTRLRIACPAEQGYELRFLTAVCSLGRSPAPEDGEQPS